jgi:hypothetical protein
VGGRGGIFGIRSENKEKWIYRDLQGLEKNLQKNHFYCYNLS